MLVKSFSSAIDGINAQIVTVEVDISPGVQFNMVGLADNAVRESMQRINAAFANNNLKKPLAKITINLAPANIRKEGSHYDLPIAIGVLAASEQVPADRLSKFVILGELSLDGTIQPVKGALPIAIEAKYRGFEGIILPKVNENEAAIVDKLKVYGVNNLVEVVEILNGTSTISPAVFNTRRDYDERVGQFDIDMVDVKGQEGVKRALEIAVAGGHNVIMIGPPGSGKSMLAARMSTISPPMNLHEALEVTKIHSVAGKGNIEPGLITKRPFRAPHHITSNVAIVGGGNTPQPGEISLAHNGVLFLDELPEFNRQTLEVLRQPLEERQITISRARYTVTYPANFMLIAAMNPCPCGFLTHPDKTCTCSPGKINSYLNKISGPLMDRIDIHIEITPVELGALAEKRSGETSETIRKRVVAARKIQQERFKEQPNIHCNAMMTPGHMEVHCTLSEQSQQLIKDAMKKLGLSARAYDRIIKVARTIADLDGAEFINDDHITEAIGYRNLDKDSWVNFY